MPDEAEYSLSEPMKTCEWCKEPMPPSRSRSKRPKRFCRDAHRAAFHNHRKAMAIATISLATKVIDDKVSDIRNELNLVRATLEELRGGGS